MPTCQPPFLLPWVVSLATLPTGVRTKRTGKYMSSKFRLIASLILGCYAASASAASGRLATLGEIDTTAPAPEDSKKAASADSVRQIPYLRLATWDLDGLGSTIGRTDRDAMQIAEVISQYDLVALQGIASPAHLDEIRQVAGTLTEVEWGMVTQSAPNIVGSALKPPMVQAFMWRADRVAKTKWAGAIPQEKKVSTARIEREPFFGQFVFQKSAFIVANVDTAETNPYILREELKQLGELVDWVGTAPRKPALFLLGNFNVDPRDGRIASVSSRLRPLVTQGGTLIDRNAGKFSNLYDQIWTNLASPMRSGIYVYPPIIGRTPRDAFETVSPHLPVFALVNVDW